MTDDFGLVETALGLFASAIKSGEDWTDSCKVAQTEAYEALSRIRQQVNSLQERDTMRS